MRVIDGVRYISAKEYAEMMNLTVGRVSQIKSDLPFVKFEEFGIELINFDLLSLSQNEKVFAQGKFDTTTAIHTLSYKDLGNYFSKLVMELANFKGTADIQIGELQSKVNDLMQNIETIQIEKSQALSALASSELYSKELQAEFDEALTVHENTLGEFASTKGILDEIKNKYEVLEKELQEFRVVHKEAKHELEIKVIENKNLITENESLARRIEAMELSAKSDTDFREEFKAFKQFVMDNIKQSEVKDI